MTTPSATSLTITALPSPVRRVEHCMGTVFSIDVRVPGCLPSVVDEVVRWLHWTDETFSTYRPDSAVSRLDRGEVSLADCPIEVKEILTRCHDLEQRTGGYFSAQAEDHLDPSGLVKGWAIQRASDILAAAGSRNHCVNGGGDVRCVGSTHGGEPWRIGITDPLQRNALAAIVAGTDLAVATSGNAERGSHIIDPHTGAPATTLASVTLVGSDLATTDAYATAAFAMGDAAPAWIQELDGYSGLVIWTDGRRWSSPGF